jgi:hypothetical protein
MAKIRITTRVAASVVLVGASALVFAALAHSNPSENRSRPTSDTFVIASGTEAGHEWALRGQRAVAEGPNAQAAGVAGREGLCIRFEFETYETQFRCAVAGNEALSPGTHLSAQFVDRGREEWGVAYYGYVSRAVEDVELVLANGDSVPATIASSPPGLRLNFDFFIGMAPTGQDVEVVAYDRSGRTIGRVERPALPLLTVTTDGSGEGTVTDDVGWVTCGGDCVASLDGGDVTLEATPDEGSVFVGWSGACSGTGSCTVAVGEDKTVTATFEDAS